MAFLTQKLIWTINIWFNFVFGSFFEQDHLLNLFILGVLELLLSEDLSIGRTLNEKKYGGTGLVSEKKRKLCMKNLMKERKQPPVVIL